MRARLALTVLVGAAILASVSGCGSGRCMFCQAHHPGAPLARAGDEIVVGGQLFHTGARVVLWLDPKGYDAYRAQPFFEPPGGRPTTRPVKEEQHYGQRRRLPNELAAVVATEGWTLENLRKQVRQFVIHYDVAGTARFCFYILQDRRTLSVQFLLDVDGTIYQTLDLKERAWHAGGANDLSVGIEIAHMGAYSTPEGIQRYYAFDELGPYFVLPASARESGVLSPGFIPRPARKELISGKIHGQTLYQYDFTNEQYAALIKLTATLHRALPGIALDVPRNPDGTVRTNVLSEEELATWSGLIGHYHVTRGKIDPGPAFDWERLIQGARNAPRL